MKSFSYSSTTSQYLVINGILEIKPDGGSGTDYHFASNSEIIFANEYSGILVKAGAKLTIDQASVHGCLKLWESIKTEPHAMIEVKNNSKISDARIAIWGFGNESNLKVTNSTFNRNVACIAFGDDPFGILGGQFTVKSSGISGNIFQGNNQLLPNAPHFSFSIVGINLQNLTNLITIGDPAGNLNEFYDFDHPDAGTRCISALNTNLTVVKSHFSEVGLIYPTDRYGIVFNSETGLHTLTIEGLGPNQPMFEHLRNGIGGHNFNLNISNAAFSDNEFDIYYSKYYYGTYIPPVNFGVYNCTFKDYRGGGIVLNSGDNALFSNKIHIVGNHFIDGNINAPLGIGVSGSFGDRFAIRIKSSIPSVLHNCHIRTNDITLQEIAGDNFLKGGIYLFNGSKATVELNTIIDNDNNGMSGSFFEGIHLEGCRGTSLLSNNITGNPTTTGHLYDAGIKNMDALTTNLNCNQIDKTWYSIEFSGNGSDNAKTYQNVFNTHTAGFYIHKNAVIGDQFETENKWIGTSSPQEAYLEWDKDTLGTYNPQDPMHRAVVTSHGIFSINSPGLHDPNDVYWPSPRIIDNTNDDGVWFQKKTNHNPSNQSFCLATNWTGSGGEPSDPTIGLAPPPLSGGEQLVLDGIYPYFKGDGWAWDANLRLYGRLQESSVLRPGGSQPAAWYNAKQNTSFSALVDILNGIYVLNGSNPTERLAMQNAYEAMLSDQKNGNEIQFGSDLNAYQQLTAAFGTSKSTLAGQLLAQANAVTPVNLQETNLKAVETMILTLLYQNRSDMTESERSNIQSIANQCRYQGGWGVVLARYLLPQATYNDDASCAGTTARGEKAENIEATGLRIAPNPVTNMLSFTLDRPCTQGTARIYNTLGRTIKEWNFNGAGQSVEMNLAPGIYLLEIQTEYFKKTVKFVKSN